MLQNLKNYGSGIKKQKNTYNFLCLNKTKWCGWGYSRSVSCFWLKSKWRACKDLIGTVDFNRLF